MIKVKNSEPKTTTAKRTIVVDCVTIENGNLVDGEGSIAGRIAANLPKGVDLFTIKIQVELPEEE